ncbi:MAG TPA: UDP-N-acetylmuramoyl-tripeptide--D-alanyl-D-alanine ligase [Burkholderiales bacterium]
MFDLVTAARAIGARHIGSDAEILRVTTDSRDVRAGDLFIGIRGDRFDGQAFAGQALQAGAAAAMVTDATAVNMPDARLLVVPDSRIALGQLSAYWRSQFEIPLIAITGSNGKTTVKELLASILRKAAGNDSVLATVGNLNNDIGMPLTLLSLRSPHRYAVIEMGMNHLGEIAYLSRLAKPGVALINNAGTAHIGELGSIEAIARAKGEIFEGLDRAGTAVINNDDAQADYWRGLVRGRKVVDFGLDRKAAVSARYELTDAGSLMTVQTPEGQLVATLNVPGMHNVKNALAAATVAYVLGIDSQAIVDGLGAYQGVKGRLQRKRMPSGAELIDDTYNANQESMKAAISVLASRQGRKLFVMGDMGELGENAEAIHIAIGEFAKRAGVDRLYTLGAMSELATRSFGDAGRHFSSVEALASAVSAEAGAGATVLVKGSRFMRMERVVEALGAISETTAKGGG